MRTLLVILAIPLLSALAGCDGRKPAVTLTGDTMGTTFHVTVVAAPETVTTQALEAAVARALDAVNTRLSNWDPASELSRFNASRSLAPVTPSPELAAVMAEAYRLHALTGGRFDVTVAPLIDLWGFGPGPPAGDIPSDAAIAAARRAVGMATVLSFDAAAPRLAKRRADATVNLSAIAKGYGVDRVAEELRALGVENYLVEIGGDLASRGVNAEGEAWRIGIERPDSATRTVQIIVAVSGRGMATSGDYRNYVERDGKRYSHIIDPVTGRPVTHALASVTVIADTAMRADGLATALLVLGPDAGLALAEKHRIAAYFIVRSGDGFVEKASPEFDGLRAAAE